MKRQLFTTLMAILLAFSGFSQIQFWVDDFEGASSSNGTRTPSFIDAAPVATRYFRAVTTPEITAAPMFAGMQGARFWAAEDVDNLAAGDPSQDVAWSVNISGKTGITFEGFFAATLGTVWDHGSSTALQDFMIIQYKIDAGPWTTFISFQPNVANSATGALSVDSNNDGLGDGAVLTNNFANFTAAIPGTGTTLQIRCESSTNALAEELAFDNFRLFEAPACTNPTITLPPSSTSVCNTGNTSFTINATGATAYQWQVNTGSGFGNITNGGIYSNATTSTLNITGATSGMSGYLYRCLATSGGGACSTTSSQAMLTVSTPVITPNSQTNVACFGGTTGAASVNAAGGGISPYTYNWTPGTPTGDGTISVSNLSAGTWTCTVTDNIGCTASQNFTVTQPPSIVVTPNTQTNVSCFGGSNGAASINTPTGGAGGYTYNWTPGNPTGDGTTVVTGLTATTWTCTVTDANSCTRTQNFTVTAPPALVVTPSTQTNVSCFGGSNGAASINTPTGGAGGYTYNWTPGNPTGDGTTVVTGLTAQTYTCTVTDANSCTATQNFTVTAPPAIVVTPNTQTNVSCFGGSNGAASINTPTGGAGGYTYNWTPGNPTGDGTTSVTGLTATTWTCTVTDANSCTRTQNFTVTAPPAIVVTPNTQTNVSCFGGSNGAASINTPTGGAGGYTYNWTPGNPTGDGTTSVTGLTAQTYTCTVTDANSCTATQNFTVTQPASAVSGTTVVTNVACFGGNTGAINLTPTGGTGPYTFNWGGGITTEDRTSLTAGTYTVIITDANSCTGTVNATVTQPTSAVSGTTVVTNVSCFGGSNGAINLTPTGGTGPYTFNWLPSGPTTEDRTGLVAGTYSVQITDANACTGTVSGITVTQPTAPVSGTTVVTNVACFGGNTGAINLTPTGGTGPYTFFWLPSGPTTEDRTSLTAGTYSVIITDVNGCTGTVNATVTQPTSPVSGTTVVTNVACFGGNTGSINLTPTGGTGPYTYNWGGGITTEDRIGLTAGTYTVIITDANSCTGTVNATVTQPTSPVSGTTVVTNVACFGGSNGAINLTPAGGTGPYTFNWGGGITTEDRTGLSAGTYSVIITDANSCTGTVSGITVTQPTAPVSGTTVVTNVSCFGGSNGTINLTPTGGTGSGYTFNWGGGITTEDRTGLSTGTYSVIITDANGCTGTVSGITVTQPTAISFTAASQTNISCFGGSNGAFSVNAANGGTGSFTYDWAPGTPTGDGTTSVTGLTAGTYTVTATDANGCTATISFTITEPTPISFTAASQTNVSCFGGSTGEASVNAATGGMGGFTYDWAPGTPTGDGTTSITGLTAGTYTVTATDANGCTATQTFTVTQPALITSSVTATDCDSYTLNGTTYNTSGTYTQNLIAVNGCDSVLTLNLTINNSTSSTTTVTECDSYEWTDGTTYTVSGTYTQDLTNSVGCDSTATLVLTINNSTSSTTTITACDSYEWTDGTTYTVSGTYTQDLTNSVGCDSTATLVLTINNSTSSTTTVTECDSYEWTNGTTYTVSGTYTQDLTNSVGCDSTATLVLTINNSTSSTTTVTACDSYEWTDGTTYTVSGTYTQDLTNSVGCDSTATLVLTINNSTSSTTTVTACDSYEWTDGTTYTVSGTYTQDLTNSVGCDSTAMLNLTITTTPVVTVNQTDDVTLVATSTSGTYQWIDCATEDPIVGETSATFVATENGSYAVVVTDGPCSVVSTCTIIDNVGIEENSTSSFELVNVYPNPFNNALTVVLSGNNEPAQLVILDALGRAVFVDTTSANETTIDVSGFASGMYVLKVISGDKIVSRSITK